MTAHLPGFSAERSVTGPGSGYPEVAHSTRHVASGVRPAQEPGPCASPTSQDCLTCWADCIAPCAPRVRDCYPSCRIECGGQPRDPGPVGGAGGGPSPPPISFGRYGNYCGPGHGDETGLTPPVDAVDAVCRNHDLCYLATTYYNCGCDRTLLTSMPAAIAATESTLGKLAGQWAIAYFGAAPCTCTWCPWGPFGPCFPTLAGSGGAGPC